MTNAFINQNDYFNRYGDFREGSKFLVSKNTITFFDTQKETKLISNLSMLFFYISKEFYR